MYEDVWRNEFHFAVNSLFSASHHRFTFVQSIQFLYFCFYYCHCCCYYWMHIFSFVKRTSRKSIKLNFVSSSRIAVLLLEEAIVVLVTFLTSKFMVFLVFLLFCFCFLFQKNFLVFSRLTNVIRIDSQVILVVQTSYGTSRLLLLLLSVAMMRKVGSVVGET